MYSACTQLQMYSLNGLINVHQLVSVNSDHYNAIVTHTSGIPGTRYSAMYSYNTVQLLHYMTYCSKYTGVFTSSDLQTEAD